ncbi:MAG: HU family DNA-binding protein [Polyangiaceae bacterium]|nr:HU family DNA-binding protein [Polyangiaceae bacterium]
MSMHELEDLVEESIRCLDAAPHSAERDVRSLIKSLYDFQARWDTGFTNFRVMDILLARRFAYAFELEDHPDYERLGRLPTTEDDAVLRDPSLPFDEEDNPEVGYVGVAGPKPLGDRRRLFCDAGSDLWRRMVEAGKLRGADAEPPNALSVEETAAAVMQAAEQRGDRDLIGKWFGLLGMKLGRRDLAELRGSPAIRALRAVACRVAANETDGFAEFAPPVEPEPGSWFALDPALDVDTPAPTAGEAEALVRELVLRVPGSAPASVAAWLRALPDAIASRLAAGESVALPGLATFTVSLVGGTPSRTAVNPFTGQPQVFAGVPGKPEVVVTVDGALNARLARKR